MTEQWQELKETIIEMRDNDGTGTQQEVCKFLANYMNNLEKQMSGSGKPDKWVLVSEKLPESDGHYIVIEKSGRVCTYVFKKEGNSEEYWKRCAIAWMPYKVEAQEIGTMEQRTEGMKKQAQELIEQTYNRGYRAGYSKAENDYHANTEKDRQLSYELGLNMAWEASKKICLSVDIGGLPADEIKKIFDFEWPAHILTKFSASEVVEKLKTYEDQKKHKEDAEIRVGDEVILNANSSFKPNKKAIVIANDNSTRYPYNVMVDNGDTEWVDIDAIDRKTGRKFPEITEVLKKIQEGE